MGDGGGRGGGEGGAKESVVEERKKDKGDFFKWKRKKMG